MSRATGGPFGVRVGRHLAFAWRAVRAGALVALAGGLLLRLVLPVEDSWISAAVGAGCVVLGIFLLVLDRGDLPLPSPQGQAGLESLGAAAQWAQAFLRSALVLAAFAVGLLAGAALGLGRA
jgi:hypothetical protein